MTLVPGALRAARLEAGLSLRELGHGVVTRQAVHLYETGRARPAQDVINILANRLDVPVTSLVVATPTPATDTATWPYTRDARLEALAEARDLRGLIARSREILESSPVRDLAAQAHLSLGRALVELGNAAKAPEAIGHLRHARQLMEEFASPWHTAEAMDWESFGLYLLGRTAEACALVESALHVYRGLEPRDAAIEARMLEHLGTYRLREHAFDVSLATYEEALSVSGRMRDLARLARTYHGLFVAEWSTAHAGDDSRRMRAVERARTAVELYRCDVEQRPDEDQVPLARIENDLATVLVAMGRLSEAESFVGEALRRLRAAGEEHVHCYALLTLAEVRQRQHQMDDAFAAAHQALELSEHSGEVAAKAAALQRLALLHGELGEHELMGQHYTRAIRVLEAAAFTSRRDEYQEAYARLLGASAAGPAIIEGTA